MKSEVFAKATAKLAKEVAEQDIKSEDKSIAEILDAEPRTGVSGSDTNSDGEDEKEV